VAKWSVASDAGAQTFLSVKSGWRSVAHTNMPERLATPGGCRHGMLWHGYRKAASRKGAKAQRKEQVLHPLCALAPGVKSKNELCRHQWPLGERPEVGRETLGEFVRNTDAKCDGDFVSVIVASVRHKPAMTYTSA